MRSCGGPLTLAVAKSLHEALLGPKFGFPDGKDLVHVRGVGGLRRADRGG